MTCAFTIVAHIWSHWSWLQLPVQDSDTAEPCNSPRVRADQSASLSRRVLPWRGLRGGDPAVLVSFSLLSAAAHRPLARAVREVAPQRAVHRRLRVGPRRRRHPPAGELRGVRNARGRGCRAGRRHDGGGLGSGHLGSGIQGLAARGPPTGLLRSGRGSRPLPRPVRKPPESEASWARSCTSAPLVAPRPGTAHAGTRPLESAPRKKTVGPLPDPPPACQSPPPSSRPPLSSPVHWPRAPQPPSRARVVRPRATRDEHCGQEAWKYSWRGSPAMVAWPWLRQRAKFRSISAATRGVLAPRSYKPDAQWIWVKNKTSGEA